MNKSTKTTPKKRRRQWHAKFISELSRTGNVTQASLSAGIDRGTAYKDYHANQDFAMKWDEALEQSVELLELEARRRAAIGVAENIYYKGEKIDTVKRYSDTLLIFLLKAHKPNKYNDTLHVKVDAEVQKELDEIYDTLERELPAEQYEAVLKAISGESQGERKARALN